MTPRWLTALAFTTLLASSPARADFAWQRSPLNPVIPYDLGGGYALDPFVLHDESTGIFRMWFTAKIYGGPWSIYHAVSSDGNSWFLYAGNPVLQGGAAEFESDGVGFAGVVYDGTQYRMLYTGVHGGYGTAIGLATSQDGLEWTKFAGNPVLAGSGSGWDSLRVGAAEALRFDGSTYWLYYAAGNGQPGLLTGLATSNDAVHWTRHPSNPVLAGGAPGSWDEADAEARGLLVHEGTHYLFYTAQAPGAPRAAVGMATSTDGITWTRSAAPVLTGGGPASWDYTVRGGFAIVVSDSVKLWYSGTVQGGAQWSIGVADSRLDPPGPGPAPNALALAANFPNPFDVGTTIPYDVPTAGRVRLQVLDLAGRIVATLVDEPLPSGRHRAAWKAIGQPSGMYFVRLAAGGSHRIRRLVLAR